jgi:hypothetical protein
VEVVRPEVIERRMLDSGLADLYQRQIPAKSLSRFTNLRLQMNLKLDGSQIVTGPKTPRVAPPEDPHRFHIPEPK